MRILIYIFNHTQIKKNSLPVIENDDDIQIKKNLLRRDRKNSPNAGGNNINIPNNNGSNNNPVQFFVVLYIVDIVCKDKDKERLFFDLR